jgi:hypothetical protein
MTAINLHDHFDGSAHCIQCGGECRLSGAELALTEMIRWQFEAIARGAAFLSYAERSTLERIGVDIEAFMQRAMRSDEERRA